MMDFREGRFASPLAADAQKINETTLTDRRLYRADLTASAAHAAMLGACGILSAEESRAIQDELGKIRAEMDGGTLAPEKNEDLFAFLEKELLARLGETGGKLGIARSQNDRIATDLRIYSRQSTDDVISLLKDLLETLVRISYENTKSVIPGFSHLRKAQPLNLAQYFNAYAEMFLRDLERFEHCRERINVLPLGSEALAGTSFEIDREVTRSMLGFDDISQNSVDAVSDRDFIAEYLFCAAMTMSHLSRLSEDMILYTSDEFGYWILPDEYSVGTPDLPQKKNPDVPELVRGRTGRIYGELFGVLTVLKGIPLSYNGDLKETETALFETEATLKECLAVFTALLKRIDFRHDVMFDAAGNDFSTASDVKDYLIKKGMPLSEAQLVTGKLVKYCLDHGKTLTRLSLDEFRAESSLFGQDILAVVTTRSSVEARSSVGGSSQDAARHGTLSLKRRLKKH